MEPIWKSIIAPFRKKLIQSIDSFIFLLKSYGTEKRAIDQIKDFIIADTTPEVKGGFVNMVLVVEDEKFNIQFKKRPTKYFEILIYFQIFILSENFRTGEKENDVHIIIKEAQEISRRQFTRFTYQSKSESPAEKTLRFMKKYPSVFKN